MRALTVWQPWASLIIAGAKTMEFRTWPPPHSIANQRIIIHAAKRHETPRRVAAMRRWIDSIGGAKALGIVDQAAALHILNDAPWPSGFLLGTVRVVSAHQSEGPPLWRTERPGWRWELVDPSPQPQIEARGYQGLWTPAEESRAEMEATWA